MTNLPLLAQPGGDARPDLHHAGDLSWRDFSKLVDQAKAHLAAQTMPPARRHRVFSTFVEMAYNVLHHAVRSAPKASEPWRLVKAEIALGHAGGAVWIATANLVDAREVPALERRVRAIRAMAPEELRAAYRDQLSRAGERAGSAGAGPGGGLGLLTIARDSALPIEFSFAPATADGGALFSLKVHV